MYKHIHVPTQPPHVPSSLSPEELNSIYTETNHRRYLKIDLN